MTANNPFTRNNRVLEKQDQYEKLGPRSKPLTPKPSFTKQTSKIAIDPNFVPDDTSNLQPGMQVIHQRFGKGHVTAIEGTGDTRKASVLFDEFGEKQLVLKFAKLKIDQKAMN